MIALLCFVNGSSESRHDASARGSLVGWRPQIDTDLRALIRRMSIENPLWGAPRIHGELLKLGFKVAQSSVAKYMVERHGPPSQGWRTFLRNRDKPIAPGSPWQNEFAERLIGSIL